MSVGTWGWCAVRRQCSATTFSRAFHLPAARREPPYTSEITARNELSMPRTMPMTLWKLRAGDALQQEIPAQERKTGQSGRSRIRRAKQKKRRNAGVIEERKRDA
ncbi:uncharacterized protein LOC100577632 isoform X2 [Apis mellifera]|uniref:Uncharacterized protein LOC100577632 isoform X2 n=1 Tax=Apis mellifera TaxID=7460 RepID=A0A7M7IJM9_APIME|nr:uncharacterized protein LOC100577632 isoform X2 [Apis mellifera]|eukprot:XP_016771754.1 uncharacterized protein LOC100577632 isoform X2 [Apis mellifera]